MPRSGTRMLEGDETRRGVDLAIAEANARAGRPRYALVARVQGDVWGAGSRQIVDLAFEDRVIGMIGGVDRDTAHLMEQVAQKARLVYLTPWAGDPVLTQAGVPWIFTVAPNDNQRAATLLHALFAARRLSRVGVVVCDDRSSSLASRAFVYAANVAGHPVPPSQIWHVPEKEASSLPAAMRPAFDIATARRVQAVAVFAPLTLDKQIRRQLAQRLPRVVLVSSNTCGKMETAFQHRYYRRYRQAPELPAACAYDSAWALIRAIEITPPSKRIDSDAIRRSLAHIQFPGVTGPVRFDWRGRRLLPDSPKVPGRDYDRRRRGE